MMNMPEKPKIVVIVGATATGKSDFAVRVARRFKGEVVSADSRQIYRGLDIGTGKITKREMRSVPHHMLDVASPKNIFSAAAYTEMAKRVTAEVLRRGSVPVIAGGAGFYIRALVDGITIPEVKPDTALRAKLEHLPAAKLFAMLKKLDPRYAESIDRHNPRRLVRAIEIASTLGAIPPLKRNSLYMALKIGIIFTPDELASRIRIRLKRRLKCGMVAEARMLHAHGLSWKRMEDIGLEYRYLSRYLRGKVSRIVMETELEHAIIQYAKRQMTWFKKDKDIHWYTSDQLSSAMKDIGAFLKKKKPAD
jgi:tRNA dimethylallyltransferase